MSRKLPDWLRVADVPAYYYRQTNEKVPTTQTVRNWITHGRRDYNGAMTHLKHKINNGMWMTRKAWVDEFINRMQGVTFSDVS